MQPVREDLDGPRKAYNIDIKARCKCLRLCHAARAGDPTARCTRLRCAPATQSADSRSAGACSVGGGRRAVRGCPASRRADARAAVAARLRCAQAPIYTELNTHPRAMEHKVGWRRVLAGDPVEVSANDGGGFKVMTINEYTAAWKVR